MWEDISAGIFSTFLKMAKSTGGVTESSAKIVTSLIGLAILPIDG